MAEVQEQEEQLIKFTDEQIAIAKKYDLTENVMPFLDRHLIYLLVDNLELIYSSEEVESLEYQLVKDTNMIRFIKEKYSNLYPGKEFPAELLEKENFVNEELVKLNSTTKKTLEILSSQEVQQNLKQDKTYNREYLSSKHDIDDSKILELYNFGKFQYNRGDYVMASDLLNNFRLLSTNQDLNLSATWGKLSSEIISMSWNDALEELNKLREIIDNRHFKGTPLDQLNKRTWLIHFSLFVFFNSDNGLESLVDLFFSSSYLSTIQASCPWILRYLVVAVLNSKPQQRQKRLKDLVKAVQIESYEYSDPFTNLINALYVDFDFEKIGSIFKEVKVLAETDFFIGNLPSTELIKNIETLIFEVVSKVYKALPVEELKTFLNIESDDEIVSIASESKDTITVENGAVNIKKAETGSVYQQLYEKTKAFNFKTNQLLGNAFGNTSTGSSSTRQHQQSQPQSQEA
ncbi:hypothetical protein CANARDRAFT_27783 [[Candida] arabinofermentans NRRL YB-2248]|uniref:Eukaryotic translation initiation factor 3 subunit E n=1 Tax=[Candida] arabinofermentans NRRL YB-2248 TaxID=983967 RepID=A0A1E4T1N7_9ASCO|nr:hypothetical protein CANARDRAFT_27783 [[Candida] arabinofermentans NRRL YB-2248]